MRDVWSSSKSVLHLALSFRLDVEGPFPGDGARHKLLSMLANPHWIEDCLERAERWRTLFIPYSPLGICPDEMIQVLPAEC